jgi:serine/threonine protein kinase
MMETKNVVKGISKPVGNNNTDVKSTTSNTSPKIEFIQVQSWTSQFHFEGVLGTGAFGKLLLIHTDPFSGQVHKVREKLKSTDPASPLKLSNKWKALKILPDTESFMKEVDHHVQGLSVKGILHLEKVYFCHPQQEVGLLFPLAVDFEKWWESTCKKQSTPLQRLQDVISIAKSLLETLAEMHEVGIIHRDLKPDNIVFSETTPKIIDLGYSRYRCDNSQSQHPFTANYTLVVKEYRAPELNDKEFYLADLKSTKTQSSGGNITKTESKDVTMSTAINVSTSQEEFEMDICDPMHIDSEEQNAVRSVWLTIEEEEFERKFSSGSQKSEGENIDKTETKATVAAKKDPKVKQTKGRQNGKLIYSMCFQLLKVNGCFKRARVKYHLFEVVEQCFKQLLIRNLLKFN